MFSCHRFVWLYFTPFNTKNNSLDSNRNQQQQQQQACNIKRTTKEKTPDRFNKNKNKFCWSFDVKLNTQKHVVNINFFPQHGQTNKQSTATTKKGVSTEQQQQQQQQPKQKTNKEKEQTTSQFKKKIIKTHTHTFMKRTLSNTSLCEDLFVGLAHGH